MTNRLLRNWMTTGLAILIVLYCMYQQHNGAEWNELLGFWGMALLLLRSKDSLIGLPKE